MYAYGSPKEAGTPRGLRWCMVAFVFYIVMMIIQIIFGGWISITLYGIDPQTPESQIRSIMMILLLTSVISIIGLLAMIFYFIGFGYLYSGRDELGPKHSKYVWTSLFLIIGAIVAYGVGIVSQFLISFSLFGTNYSSPAAVKEMMTNTIIASSITGGIAAAFVAGAISLSILALIAPQRKLAVFTAAIIGTATPGIVGVMGLLQISDLVDRLFRSGSSMSLNASIGLPTVVGASLGIITFFLFLYVYYQVSNSIKRGELRPVVKQPQPMWVPTAYFVPVMPYQPYMPVQQPYSPPPQPVSPIPPITPPEQQ